MIYWIESSWDFEDTGKENKEYWVVAVDYGEDGTESIATFDKSMSSNPCPIKGSVDDLLKHVNREIKEKK